MLRITGKLLQCLGSCLKQQVVEAAVIDPNEGIELMGQSEDDVEGGNGQERALPRSHPLGRGPAGTLGTVAITTRAVTDAVRPASPTLLDMATQRCRAALGECPQDARLL